MIIIFKITNYEVSINMLNILDFRYKDNTFILIMNIISSHGFESNVWIHC